MFPPLARGGEANSDKPRAETVTVDSTGEVVKDGFGDPERRHMDAEEAEEKKNPEPAPPQAAANPKPPSPKLDDPEARGRAFENEKEDAPIKPNEPAPMPAAPARSAADDQPRYAAGGVDGDDAAVGAAAANAAERKNRAGAGRARPAGDSPRYAAGAGVDGEIGEAPLVVTDKKNKADEKPREKNEEEKAALARQNAAAELIKETEKMRQLLEPPPKNAKDRKTVE